LAPATTNQSNLIFKLQLRSRQHRHYFNICHPVCLWRIERSLLSALFIFPVRKVKTEKLDDQWPGPGEAHLLHLRTHTCASTRRSLHLIQLQMKTSPWKATFSHFTCGCHCVKRKMHSSKNQLSICIATSTRISDFTFR
jgi:hypothetical protein